MGQNLTGKTIASTYEDLVQISGSILSNGVGTDITNLTVTASFATTASYALNVPSFDTGSLMITGSVSTNVLTFEKGDGSTFSLTVDTGSAVTVDTGSLLVTASISDATITFTKGDASTFDITVNNVENAFTASTAGTAGYALTAGTSGFATSASFADQAGTAGYAATAGTSGFAISASFADQAGTSGYAATAGTAGFATSASYADNALSSSYALTASYVEGGVDPFPYTGSAIITGSLTVIGPISGLLSDLESIEIFTTSSANAVVPNILIGAQDPSVFNLNTGIGTNNVVIGGGEFLTDIKGIASGSGNSNTVVGGWGGFIGKGQHNTIVGGGQNQMASGSTLSNSIAAQYNAMVGGTSNTMSERTTYSVIIGGITNTINQAGTNGSAYSTIIGGQTNYLSGSDWAGIFSSKNSDITFGNYVNILGGNNNTAVYATSTNAYSAMIAGNGNTLSHVRSVVIGGQNLSSSKNDEVVVPNLSAYGTASVAGPVIVSGSITINNPTEAVTDILFATNSLNIGSGNTMARGTYGANAIVGFGHTISGDGSGLGLFGGTNNTISGGERTVILGGFGNASTNGTRSFVIGGTTNNSSNNSYGGVIGGQNNTSGHDRSVVIGGSGISTAAADTVYVPNLNVSGSATFKQGAIVTGSILIQTGSLSGSAVDNINNITGSTQVKHVAYCTQAEYDAITPDDNTLYFISSSGDSVSNLTVTDSLLVSGSTTFTGSVVGNVGALSISSNTASLDLSTGNFFTLQLVGSTDTRIEPSNIQAGQTINLLINTTGSATVSFPSSVKQVSGSAYVPTTTTSQDIVTFISFDTSSLFLSNVKNLV